MSQHFQSGDDSPATLPATLAETLDLYLLDALASERRAEVAVHLAQNCAECHGELRLARTRLAALVLAAPEQAPRPELKRHILQAIAATASSQPAPRPARRPRALGWSWSWGPLAVALALLCLIVYGRMSGLQQRARLLQTQLGQTQRQMQAALGQNRDLRFAAELIAAPATQTVEIKATPAAPRGRAYLNPARGAVLIADNLAPAAPQHAYELWLLPAKGNPIPAGVFQASATGSAIQTYPQPLSGIVGLAVSLEPSGGSPQPTGPIVLAAKLRAATP